MVDTTINTLLDLQSNLLSAQEDLRKTIDKRVEDQCALIQKMLHQLTLNGETAFLDVNERDSKAETMILGIKSEVSQLAELLRVIDKKDSTIGKILGNSRINQTIADYTGGRKRKSRKAVLLPSPGSKVLSSPPSLPESSSSSSLSSSSSSPLTSSGSSSHSVLIKSIAPLSPVKEGVQKGFKLLSIEDTAEPGVLLPLKIVV